VAEAIRRIRDEAKDAETIYYLYVTDPQEHLLGVFSLRELILADPASGSNRSCTPTSLVSGRDRLREVAELQTKYNLWPAVVSGEVRSVGSSPWMTS